MSFSFSKFYFLFSSSKGIQIPEHGKFLFGGIRASRPAYIMLALFFSILVNKRIKTLFKHFSGIFPGENEDKL